MYIYTCEYTFFKMYIHTPKVSRYTYLDTCIYTEKTFYQLFLVTEV